MPRRRRTKRSGRTLARQPVGKQRYCSESQLRQIDPIWVFGRVPANYWQDENHRRNYMFWLGGKLRFRYMEDWYRITKEAFRENCGSRVLALYGQRPSRAVMSAFPEYDWHEWRFSKTPAGFWHSANNRKRYLLWLGDQVGIRRPDEWLQIDRGTIVENHGATMLTLFCSHADALREAFPELDWNSVFYQPLSVRQILRWADLYHRLHGRWPTSGSGQIEGTSENWKNIDHNLRNGDRGLCRGLSLARLLNQYRGVPNSKDLPELTEKKILRWADAHFKRHKTWPGAKSGIIAGTSESWHLIDVALRYGCRGLPGGSSLAILLEQRRGRLHSHHRPRLTEQKIVRWMKRYRRQFGRWPTDASPVVMDEPNENWKALDAALREGHRGLKGGLTLARLRRKHGLR